VSDQNLLNRDFIKTAKIIKHFEPKEQFTRATKQTDSSASWSDFKSHFCREIIVETMAQHLGQTYEKKKSSRQI
jgi:hypothetical protein